MSDPTNNAILAAGFTVDPRSAHNIATLLPPAQTKATELLKACAAAGIIAKVISGSRTYAEQDALYAQRPRVTRARGGYSNHNFGIAFDIGIFDQHGAYLDDSPLYAKAGAIGKQLGLSWGGDWKSFPDEPHFELHPDWAKAMSESVMLAALRNRHEQRQGIFA